MLRAGVATLQRCFPNMTKANTARGSRIREVTHNNVCCRTRRITRSTTGKCIYDMCVTPSIMYTCASMVYCCSTYTAS